MLSELFLAKRNNAHVSGCKPCRIRTAFVASNARRSIGLAWVSEPRDAFSVSVFGEKDGTSSFWAGPVFGVWPWTFGLGVDGL
jgi:hypothetical protein